MAWVISVVFWPDTSIADPSNRVRGLVWIQPALGWSVGDDRVSGQIDADISIYDIPTIGPISATLPVSADVIFEDPTGILAGGELSVGRYGLEVNLIYLPEAATVQGGVKMCGGLLTDAECDLLRLLDPLGSGMTVPDDLIVEDQLGNLAVTVGVNYHLVAAKKWDIWAGPMIVWSVWDTYDFSDVQVQLSTSLESLLAQFRYFAGDDLDLPGGSGRYRAGGLSAGLAYRFGG
ncbi:MAG: hypothetical protein KJ970_09665 [Candidatus Eisenbacteria bacterium]|uniref:Uncharacterized protein n=1 Tax=Eiseniibacteriota bacterium TaxID=2212470 RepID=A0A948RWC8_UNCEI|nr:hypothetical protein [Candidatus Eisenbacteria bacterium]